jgi:ankyrin repeat protein
MTTTTTDPDTLKAFVLAGHFDLDKVRTLLAAHPDLLNQPYPWSETDSETALQAAGHVGNRPIAEFLLAQGAPLEIGVASMLGRVAEVEAMLQRTPALADAVVVHGFRALYHAALSGEVAMVALFQRYGCTQDYDQALHGAVSAEQPDVVAWLLANGVKNPNTPNYKGLTPLKQALDAGHAAITDLLRSHGGVE